MGEETRKRTVGWCGWSRRGIGCCVMICARHQTAQLPVRPRWHSAAASLMLQTAKKWESFPFLSLFFLCHSEMRVYLTLEAVAAFIESADTVFLHVWKDRHSTDFKCVNQSHQFLSYPPTKGFVKTVCLCSCMQMSFLANFNIVAWSGGLTPARVCFGWLLPTTMTSGGQVLYQTFLRPIVRNQC